MSRDLLADGRETLEFISARLSQDQYAALSNAIEEGRMLRFRLANRDRLVSRLRSRLARVLRWASSPVDVWGATSAHTQVWSRRVPGGRRNER